MTRKASRTLKPTRSSGWIPYLWNENTQKRVRIEEVNARRDQLIAAGYTWDQADRMSLDSDLYSTSNDAVEVGYQPEIHDLPVLQPNDVIRITNLIRSAAMAGEQFARNSTVDELRAIGWEDITTKANEAFDLQCAGAQEKGRRYVNDRVIGRPLYVYGFRDGFNAEARTRRAVELAKIH